MSPTASEKVPNRALSTAELRSLLERDFTRLCDNFSLLQSCSSFSRISWSLRLTLYTAQGPQDISLDSRREGQNVTMRKPELRVIGDAPSDPALRALGISRELRREVDSPNAERLRAGLPVPIERRQPDSTVVTEMVKYPPDETLGEGKVTESDPDAPQESAEELKARIAREADALIESMKPPVPAPPSETAQTEEPSPPSPLIPPVSPELIDAVQDFKTQVDRLTGAAPAAEAEE